MTDRSDWPQEIRSVQLANFRPSIAERAKKPAVQPWRQRRAGMSPEHLSLIRRLPCTCCEHRPSQAHHLKSDAAASERGVYLKATDRWAVPMCALIHHPEIERHGSRKEREWFARFGIDPHELANALWAASGDLARMGRVIIAHKQSAIRTLNIRRHGL